MKPVLQVENITKAYGKGANLYKALNGVSFKVHKGEFVGVMGPSGAGNRLY